LGLDLRRFWDRESFRRSVLLSIPSPPPEAAAAAAPPLEVAAVAVLVVRALAVNFMAVAATSAAGGAPAAAAEAAAAAVAMARARATASPPGGPGDPRPAVGDVCGLTAPSMLRGLNGLPSTPRSSLLRDEFGPELGCELGFEFWPDFGSELSLSWALRRKDCCRRKEPGLDLLPALR
jgi:hypothetical protein